MNHAAEKSLMHTVLEEQIIQVLREIRDPELPVNIYDLGLIYDIDLDSAAGTVTIKMTLTAPACPVAQSFPATVECAVCQISGIREARVELVWDPPWSRERMSEAARMTLGLC